MEDIFLRGWEHFLARTSGPLSFRFVLQPSIAVILAVSSAVRDAREDRPAFLWSLLTGPATRRGLITDALRQIGKVFVVAGGIDFVYQTLMFRGVYFLELLFTAFVLAILPYILIRGPVARLIKRSTKERRQEHLRPEAKVPEKSPKKAGVRS